MKCRIQDQGLELYQLEAGGCLASMAARAASESVGLSSEDKSLRAALMLPSSILDDTALARSKALRLLGPDFCRGPVEQEEPATLLLMMTLMLDRLPSLGGIGKIDGQKLKSLSHLAGSCLLAEMLDNMPVSAEQQDGRADFGMCLTTGPQRDG